MLPKGSGDSKLNISLWISKIQKQEGSYKIIKVYYNISIYEREEDTKVNVLKRLSFRIIIENLLLYESKTLFKDFFCQEQKVLKKIAEF